MSATRRRRWATAALPGALSLVLLAAACTGGAGEGATGAPNPGVLTAYSLGPAGAWDPQRITARSDMAFAGRVFARTLTAYAPEGGSGQAGQLVGDLATDTGRADGSLRVWSFTLREGPRWQDGSAITCPDLAYGISRSFAPELAGGPNYALTFLDIPRQASGASTYAGPYTRTGQAAFDHAVSCSDRTLTLRLAEPVADFNEMVSLPAFAPAKATADRRAAARYAPFSSGPYQLQGKWRPGTGGTWVRNPNWREDSDPVRRPGAREIRYEEGVEVQTAVQRVMDDRGEARAGIVLGAAPPAQQQQVADSAGLRARSVRPLSQEVDHLVPAAASPTLRNAQVRQALAVATDREAYVNALGGSEAAEVAYSLLPPPLLGHRSQDLTGAGPGGSPPRARTLLEAAEVALPARITVAYRSSPTADKALAALASGWTEAGFAVTLKPITADYFATIASTPRAAGIDLFWSNWSPAWASGSTVIPPLFDSRLNLSAADSGRDVGRFADAGVNARITGTASIRERGTREKAWGDLDADLASRGAYIALAQRRSLYVAGSAVTGLAASGTLGGYPDLAATGVR